MPPARSFELPNPHLPAMPIMLGVLAVLAVAYRYYSAFLAAKVAALDDSRETPAVRLNDGQNYHPTNRWVLFGHHFAAISGSGPLIGPVLAIQFGYVPGLIWLVVGVCLAGAVQDMMVLVASVRRDGQSLAAIARAELGPAAGVATSAAILYIIIIALAGLGIVVVKALGGEDIKLREGSILVYPASSSFDRTLTPDGTTTYVVPERSILFQGKDDRSGIRVSEETKLTITGGDRLKPSNDPEKPGWRLPKNASWRIKGSSWGTFTIACTIPIALFVGWYMYRFRKGKVVEASALGAVAVLAVTFLGAKIPGSPLEAYFDLPKRDLTAAIASYGFVASVLPVWLLLCPRDYLSSFLKIGTIAILVVGVIVANPTLEAPAINTQFIAGGGPSFAGPVFPYVFICIMCGAISGFHALVSSGTTPKMIARESDIRMIGYGAMLVEGLVGVVALIAAASLPNVMYYDINIDLQKRPQFARALSALDADHLDGAPGELAGIEREVGETLAGRTGGAVTLAVGMARIFTRAMPFLKGMVKYWYHFAIMFEALFILTTIDTGTRIGRFLVQELLGKVYKPLGNLDSHPAAFLATGLVVAGWSGFILTGEVSTIWPMFGLANQLLALIALAVAATYLINTGKRKGALCVIAPLTFVAITTLTASRYEIARFFKTMVKGGAPVQGWLNIGLTAFMLVCLTVILTSAIISWLRPAPRATVPPES